MSGPDGPPSIEQLRRAKEPGLFPVSELDGARDAAVFFCAAYLGQNDSIHLLDAGLADVFLCDLDGGKLDAMRTLYPATWRFERGDAYRIAERELRAGRQFDVVVADPWAGHGRRLLTKTFPLWYALARRRLICMTPTTWFQELGAESSAAAARDAIRRLHGLDVDVAELRRRSDWLGGIHWLVVRKSDPRHGAGATWDHSDDDTWAWRIRRRMRAVLGRPRA